MNLVVFCFLPNFVICSVFTDSGHFKCGGPLPYVKQDDLPEFEPSKYTAADPATFKPFKIHFVVPPDVSEEMRRTFNKAAVFMNDKLSAMLKAPPLAQIRRARQWNGTSGRCNPATCIHAVVAGKYAMPCQHPETGDLIKEEDVPFPVANEVDVLNKRNDITLVVHVAAERHSPAHIASCADSSGSYAYATTCQVDPVTLRPTHGSIGLCLNASKFEGKGSRRLLLHEVLHILTAANMVAHRSPAFGCITGDDPIQCENITYKVVQRQWMEAGGTWTNKTRLLLTTPNAKRAAQEYFGCATLEGAETESYAAIITLANGTNVHFSIPAHWNRRAFPDEILVSEVGEGSDRLSALTLGLLKDLGWYEVNMSAAEPMQLTRLKRDGCEIVEKSCHEIIKKKRSEKQGQMILQDITPYCDYEVIDTKRRIISPLCTNDAKSVRTCDSKDFSERCPVLFRPDDHDADFCEERTKQDTPAVRLGGTVGPGTMCLTLSEVAPGWARGLEFYKALCVAYACNHDTKMLSIILRPAEGNVCEIHCPEAKSNDVLRVDYSSDPNCTYNVGQSILVICPDFNASCPPGSMQPTFNHTPVTSPPPTHVLEDPAGAVPYPPPTSVGYSPRRNGLVVVIIVYTILSNT